MIYKGSIKKKLISIILIVSTISSLLGYGTFVYWYMQNQHKSTIKQSNKVAFILSQDIAKLIYLNDVSAAADITSNIKSFCNIKKLVIYNLNKDAVFQYSKDNKSFEVEKFQDIKHTIILNNILKTYIQVDYQNNKLGYVYIQFKIDSISNVIKQNITMFLFILLSMVIISFILATIFAKKFTNPILDLVSHLEKIDTVKHFSNIKTTEDNEYGKLYEEINTMLNRINISSEQEKIAAVAFQTQNGMIITNKEQDILQVNDSFTRITGYKKEEVIGKKPSLLSSKLQDDEYYKNMYHLLNTQNYWDGEILNKNAKGEIITEKLSIHTIRDEDNNIIYYVASFSDITQEKLTQKELKEKENILIQQSKMAAMGEMLSNISHQWRQPLSVISTISTGLITQKEMELPLTIEDEIKSLSKINETTQYLSNTINDFKNFFNPNKEKNIFNIKDSYKKSLSLSNSKLKELNIIIIENIIDITINGLENELIQVLMNIINNAKDAISLSKNNTKLIFVNIYEKDNNAIISIYDNAGGIENSIIDKIFEPYFTTKHKAQGTGIGLYMSNEIITKHMNGQIIVYNKEFIYENILYKGALFEITIPIKE